MSAALQLFKLADGRTEAEGPAMYFADDLADPTGENKAVRRGERWREQDPQRNTYRVDRNTDD